MRTNDRSLTSTVAPACRSLGLNVPNNMPVEATEERIDADPDIQPTRNDLLTRINNVWVPGGDTAT